MGRSPPGSSQSSSWGPQRGSSEAQYSPQEALGPQGGGRGPPKTVTLEDLFAAGGAQRPRRCKQITVALRRSSAATSEGGAPQQQQPQQLQ